MIKIFLGVILMVSFAHTTVFAFDWKSVHEKAESANLSSALKSAGVSPTPENKYLLGLMYLKLHREDEAETVFRSMPDVVESKWGLAEILRRKHHLKESEQILLEVTRSEPRFIPAFISLAYLKYTNKEYGKAAEMAGNVIKAGQENVDVSNYTRAYLILAGAKGMIADSGGLIAKITAGLDVLPNLKKAQQLSPDSPEVCLGLGSFYLLAPYFAGGDLKQAESYLLKAIERDSLLCDAYVRLAQVYQKKKDEAKYRQYLDEARRIDPANDLLREITAGEN